MLPVLATRAGLQARKMTASIENRFTVAEPFRIRRLKFWTSDGKWAVGDTVKIDAENQSLFSGLAVPCMALLDPTDDGIAGTIADYINRGPSVLYFDDPLRWDNDAPLVVTPNTEMWLIIDAQASPKDRNVS